MRTIIILLIFASVALQYKLWLGEGSVKQWLQVEKKRDLQDNENKQLEARNRAIAADIAELKSGDQALEEQARFELGMVKNGETYYQLVE